MSNNEKAPVKSETNGKIENKGCLTEERAPAQSETKTNSSAEAAAPQSYGKKNLKNSLIIAAISLVSFVVVFVIVFSMVVIISPRTGTKVFHSLGMKQQEEQCYVQLYKKTNSNADLYNIIILEKQLGDYDKELSYIQQLKSKEDFKQFCNKMNLTGIDYTKGQKNLYIYYADTEGYLLTREITCRFHLGLSGKEDFDILETLNSNVNGSCLTETTFSDYISLLLESKKLTKEQKTEKVREIFDFNEGGISLVEKVLNKLDVIQSSLENQEDEVTKILYMNTIIKQYEGLYNYEVMLNGEETPTAVAFKNTCSQFAEEYANMVSSNSEK